MSKPSPARAAAPARPAFTPVATRPRHDGWTPGKQACFIDALAQSGCVHEACAAVGMSRQSAYGLRMRPDAQGFRISWDAALDLAIRRLSDECYSRALNGVAIPHFYQGQQVGEHRRYDNRLAMFLLRYRDPLRYAASLDQMVYSGHAEAAAIAFAKARARMEEEAHGVADEPPPPAEPPYATEAIADATVRQKAEAKEAHRRQAAHDMAADAAERRRVDEEAIRWSRRFHERYAQAAGQPGGDVPSSLSTSTSAPGPQPPPPQRPTPRCRGFGG